MATPAVEPFIPPTAETASPWEVPGVVVVVDFFPRDPPLAIPSCAPPPELEPHATLLFPRASSVSHNALWCDLVHLTRSSYGVLEAAFFFLILLTLLIPRLQRLRGKVPLD